MTRTHTPALPRLRLVFPPSPGSSLPLDNSSEGGRHGSLAIGHQVKDVDADATNDQTVHAAVPANTFAIYGNGEDKELTELVPGILNQLGPDSLASLRKLAESYQSMQQKEGDKEADDDEIPDLVAGENFEGESKVE